jgi:CubicO group peptidase (beta-lactamase class C family)
VRPYAFRKSIAFVLGAVALVLLGGLIACAIFRPDRAIRVGTASISQTMCTEIFVAGLDPDRVYAEEIVPRPGAKLLLKRLTYRVDASQRQVHVAWANHFESVTTFREGRGCLIEAAGSRDLPPRSEAAPAGTAWAKHESGEASSEESAKISSGNEALSAALDHAFAEPRNRPLRRVRAIVVMHDGHIVAERYASGIGPDTPLLAYSVSKSVINALVGILVRKGKLSVTAPAPVPAWDDRSDPRHAITLEQLMRMTAGLDLDESDSGFDPVSRMMYLEPDMAGFAQRAAPANPPGTRWNYSSGNTLIVSGIVRDAVGGRAEDVQTFAMRELFAPLGMQHVTMTFDAADTPVGSTLFLASARDWARFGNLYVNDGVVDGNRILPAGWVRYSTTPTLDSDYGAGFWVNAGGAANARGRVRSGMPVDAFFASGNFGQRIVVIPSQRLVIVRFGATMDPPDFDIDGLEQLVVEVMKVVGNPGDSRG